MVRVRFPMKDRELVTSISQRRILVSGVSTDDREVIVDKVNIYKDAAGEYRWERRAPNGKILSDSGEGYINAKDCINMAFRVNKGAPVFFFGQPIIEPIP